MKFFLDKWEESNKENTEDLLYIDDGKRKLFYRFTPSKTNPVGAPLFIILHGHGTRAATRFQKEGWNVLAPIDHFGYEGKGCWWLGEDGDFFVKDLLQKLIKEISTQYQCENNIYFYGSSMGGYGAILHGMLCQARAVYANVPQIKLLESTYSERSMKRFFSFIFSEDVPVENNLVNFLVTVENKTDFPVFYLCENGVSGKNAHKNYLLEHTEYFVDKCKEKNIKYHLEILPKSGHNKNYGLGEVLEKFERFTPHIDKKNYYAYIIKLKDLDIKHYLLVRFKINNSYNFKPRKDVKAHAINLPIDWDMDLFDDNNWIFQLHALRLLDNEIFEYFSTKDLNVLERIVEVILDWKRDIVDTKKNFDFDREKDKDSFAWHDMATGLRAMKIAFVFEAIVKLNDSHPLKKYLNNLYELVTLHVKGLKTQKLASGNHAIFQVHGLMMLLRFFSVDDEGMSELKKNTEKLMFKIFHQQFFKEGIHTENSVNYHYLGTEVFENILSKEIYPDSKEIFQILEKSKKNYAYMHFPNNETLLTGDSDYKVRKPRKEEEMQEGITYFKESGYAYVYEENDNPSMLFFDTAFLNRAHRHADFFNVLLYEYDKNILVDAGKYSYVKDNPFRQYCISTRAHNVVMINNEDYRLDRKYFFTSKLEKKEKRENHYHLKTAHYYESFETSHDRHIFYKPMEFLFVVDVLRSKDSKNYKQVFHVHQDLEVYSEDNFIKSKINDDITMSIKMKSLAIDENKIHKNITFSKGTDGEIEGYRALGHNEVVENYVLVNEIVSSHVVMGSMFAFTKQFDFDIMLRSDNGLELLFDDQQEIIEG